MKFILFLLVAVACGFYFACLRKEEAVVLLAQRFTSDPLVCASGTGTFLKLKTGEKTRAIFSLCDGTAAPALPLRIAKVLKPCSSYSNAKILKLDDGTLVTYQPKKQPHLSIIFPGTYTDPKWSFCRFTITDQGEIF